MEFPAFPERLSVMFILPPVKKSKARPVPRPDLRPQGIASTGQTPGVQKYATAGQIPDDLYPRISDIEG